MDTSDEPDSSAHSEVLAECGTSTLVQRRIAFPPQTCRARSSPSESMTEACVGSVRSKGRSVPNSDVISPEIAEGLEGDARALVYLARTRCHLRQNDTLRDSSLFVEGAPTMLSYKYAAHLLTRTAPPLPALTSKLTLHIISKIFPR